MSLEDEPPRPETGRSSGVVLAPHFAARRSGQTPALTSRRSSRLANPRKRVHRVRVLRPTRRTHRGRWLTRLSQSSPPRIRVEERSQSPRHRQAEHLSRRVAPLRSHPTHAPRSATSHQRCPSEARGRSMNQPARQLSYRMRDGSSAAGNRSADRCGCRLPDHLLVARQPSDKPASRSRQRLLRLQSSNALSRPSNLLGAEYDRDRAGVHQLDLHPCAEDARPDLDAERA
jgi:hypothetical protein